MLDLAAGSGRHTRHLRSLGYSVTAVDVDVFGLRDFAKDANVEIVEADLEGDEWPFGERLFDGIVVTDYLHRPLLPKLADALAPGGVLIYETFGEGNEVYGRPTNPDYLLRDGELLEVYDKQLDIIAYEHVREEEPRLAVRQRLCAALTQDAAEAPERHTDASGGS